VVTDAVSFLLPECAMNATDVEQDQTQSSLTASAVLAERMDQSIGEASSVLGAVLTELVRRTLRGGVTQIGTQLESYVAEKVDESVADRLPGIERAAAEAADGVARSTAVEVARREVLVLEQQHQQMALDLTGKIDRTDQSIRLRLDGMREELLAAVAELALTSQRSAGQLQRELFTRLEEAQRAALAQTEEVRRTLSGRTEEVRQHLTSVIERNEQGVRQRVDEVKQELTGQIEQNDRTNRTEVETVHRVLTGRIGEVEKKAEQETASTATVLSAKIEETEKRVSEATSAEINRHVQELLDGSRKATTVLKNRLMSLEGTAGDLLKQLQAEAENRQEQEKKIRAEMNVRLEKERQAWQSRLEEVLEANRGLTARVEELEKPRGLRALWAWMFGRKKKAIPARSASED
jgi:hypothetical protein